MDEVELQHLEMIRGAILKKLDALGASAEESQRRVLEQKKAMWENLYEMDRQEMAVAREEISASLDDFEKAETDTAHLGRILDSPYFGRIDFAEEGEDLAAFYIGLGSLRGDSAIHILIYDWRAPVSSLFYDYDTGPASYTAPGGEISGELELRRQYKIKDGELEYVLESSIKIDDDILQKELSRTTSPRMKNIIATIQKEQNRIIRASYLNSVVVQGVAGSGKTSVALHKVAFLLYNQRGKITSKNLLILSPNQVFSSYISNVLPELGEENVVELSFDQLAQNEVGDMVKYESKYEQLEYILNHSAYPDNIRLREIDEKSSERFLAALDEYADLLVSTNFHPAKFIYGEEVFEAEYIRDLFENRFNTKPFMVRIQWICEKLFDELELRLNKTLGVRAQRAIEKALHKMIGSEDILALYAGFIRWLGDTGKMRLALYVPGDTLKYEDLFPVVYLKYRLYGSRDFSRIRHLVIDEMQDYNRIQYAIINYLFSCPKTILGDIAQNLNLHSGVRTLDEFSNQQVEIIRLNKSFRSTFEIANFANKINPIEGFEAVERHGEPPVVKSCGSEDEILMETVDRLNRSKADGHASMAVICKTGAEARLFYDRLTEHMEAVLLDPESKDFTQGVIVTTSYMAKGLEFDTVIIPNAGEENYRTEIDRQCLYVACTRALHVLHLYHTGQASRNLSGEYL